MEVGKSYEVVLVEFIEVEDRVADLLAESRELVNRIINTAKRNLP